MSVDDVYLGTTNPGDHGGVHVSRNPTATLTVPQSTPSGTYWVGWVLRAAVAEYSLFDNGVIIDGETLTVSSQGGGPDIRVEPLELRFDRELDSWTAIPSSSSWTGCRTVAIHTSRRRR